MPAKSNAAGEQVVDVDPLVIYFTFSRIRPRFSCGRTIESTIQQFRNGELQPRDLPLLSVLTDGTHYFSQNNRRLYTYKQLKREGLLDVVPVRLRPFPQTKRMQNKYTPETCSLTATLMRDVEKNNNTGENSAAARLEKNSTDDSDDEQDNYSTKTHEVKEATDATVADTKFSLRNPQEAEKTHNKPTTKLSSSPPDSAAAKQINGEQDVDGGGRKENNQLSVTLFKKQKKQQQKDQKKSTQQQQLQTGMKGRRKNISESDDDSEGGGLNSLEAELRKLGLQ